MFVNSFTAKQYTMLSLVIPVYNEEALLDELLKRTISAIESFIADYEIIFVDDGSTDSSLQKLLGYRKLNKRIKILALSKNFGHQAAFTAGLEHTSGEIVAMMDGDLQDPPELLAEMFRKISADEFDIVSGKKSGRKGRKGRNVWSVLFHIIFRQIGEIKNMENAGNYSMMNRKAVDALLSMREKIRYLPGLRTVIGFRQGYIEFIRDDRFSGEPKMTRKKLIALAADAIFSFSRFPIRFCFIVGMAGAIFFLIAGAIILFSGQSVPFRGWSSTSLAVFFIGSVQLIFLGIMGEYIYRSYKETQNRPVYFVKHYYDDTPLKNDG